MHYSPIQMPLYLSVGSYDPRNGKVHLTGNLIHQTWITLTLYPIKCVVGNLGMTAAALS